jgi:hypothetical protein
MTVTEALSILAEPEYEPFRQVVPTAEDVAIWQAQHDRRLEALRVARALR